MPKKLSYDEIKKVIESNGYSLISNEYKNAFAKLQTICPKGHFYSVRYYSFKDGHRCSECSGSKKKSVEEVKLLFEKEGYRLISTEYKNSLSKLVVVCGDGHQSMIRLSHFRMGVRCSFCKGNKKKTLEEVKLLFEKEGYKLISTEYKNNHSPLHCVCSLNHDCYFMFSNFKNGHRCLECCGKKKKTLEIIKSSIEKEGYKLISTEYKNNKDKIKVICPKNHSSEIAFDSFIAGHRCWECTGLKRKTIEYIRIFFEKEGYKLINTEYVNSASKLLVICPKNHEISIRYGDFQQDRRWPICSNNGISKPEKEIFKFISELLPETLENDTKIIAPKELDIFIPSLNLAIEYGGLYWHSEEFRDKNYHANKMKLCNEKGIRLITVFGDEWKDRKEQVKNFLLSAINKNAIKIMGRKTEIKPVSKQEGIAFLNETHIQGTALFEIAFGLYHNDELIGIVTGNKHHRQGFNNIFVLNRLAFKSNISVSGGSSKLLKALINYAKQNGYSKIISWSDNRWSEGNVYEKTGFKLTENLLPDYSYITKQTRISKQSCQKKNLIKKGAIGNTEYEMALSLGLKRIWDCGKKRWEIEL